MMWFCMCCRGQGGSWYRIFPLKPWDLSEGAPMSSELYRCCAYTHKLPGDRCRRSCQGCFLVKTKIDCMHQ